MSLPGKDFRCKIEVDIHKQLSVMAKFHNTEISSLGARLLEKAICGEWYEFVKVMNRMPKDT